MTPITAAHLAELCQKTLGQAILEGDGAIIISGVNQLESASPGELSFVANRKAAENAADSKAGCLLVPSAFENPSRRTLIRVADPRAAFAQLIGLLYPPKRQPSGVHPSACVDVTAVLGEGVSVGPHVSIGERTVLGEGCQIGAGCAIGEDVAIGAGSVLHPNVTVYDRVRIGSRALLHAGCVLGADGFGFAFTADHYEKFPQIGTVEIGDDVELGANTCVDRAALGVTRIGDGVKIDNMVHIAHNCEIGRHVVIAAQTGLSGGVVIGDYAIVGGQVGVGDKARIESKAVIGSGAGILTSKIVRAGKPVWGTPARPLREHLQQLANLAKLPEWRAQLKAMEQRLEELERARAIEFRQT
ncbi:MAG: UDP-3-O-(3-hydroxymyristoyl)glucosamine N-acyltransferase [Bryobacteraceae bacterium]